MAPKGKKIGDFYAVARGRKGPGIFRNWNKCKFQVLGFETARWKKFPTWALAKQFIEDNTGQPYVKPVSGRKRQVDESDAGTEAAEAGPSGQKKTAEVVNLAVPVDAVVYVDGVCVQNGKPLAKAGNDVYKADSQPDNFENQIEDFCKGINSWPRRLRKSNPAPQ